MLLRMKESVREVFSTRQSTNFDRQHLCFLSTTLFYLVFFLFLEFLSSADKFNLGKAEFRKVNKQLFYSLLAGMKVSISTQIAGVVASN